MFKFKKISSFKARVSFTQLGDDADKPAPGTFIAEYKKFNSKDFRALIDRGLSDDEFIDAICVGFEELQDEAGEALAFETAKTCIKDDMVVRTATITTFFDVQSSAGAKNAKTSRGR